MAQTLSTMLPLGTTAPHFTLVDTRSGQSVSLEILKSEVATVIFFICNHCPYVKHIQAKLVDIVKKYQEKKIVFIGISSNDIEKYPEDSPEKMRLEAEKEHYSFPYLYDATQAVAKAYHAACTPDFYIFDREMHCVYRGRFDDSTPSNHLPVTGKEISHALDNLIAGKPVDPAQKPSMGCNIKWKS